MIRLLLLLTGAVTLCVLVWHIGPMHIYDTVTQLGPLALGVMLLPSVVMYLVEAYGWEVALRAMDQRVPFIRLLAIRMAGEVVNMTTPTAYVGGEPLKAYLLQADRVPMVHGLASVVIAKTTMTVAQIAFILIGIGLGVWALGADRSSGQMAVAALLSAGLLGVGVAAFIFVQRRGLFTWMLGILRALRLRIPFLESREEQLHSLDRTILGFYTDHQAAFYTSAGLYLVGWLAEALEVFVIIILLGEPAFWWSALSIGALSVFIKGGTFFIPGSLGAQDAGNLLLFQAFGYSDVAGISFALLRRFRELVWIGVGLICLTVIGNRKKWNQIG
ncbi:lysylphosphatidylglycerol synthase transmembrane domain-containing protein [Nitrospira sp. KM1]|uniref:lysylphosphatidylglycerol synthase transmembrane domain-containing protein n=1 Tax=Nitrospira sp. KM1 TaxID=1936990 RepID=UPI002102B678|nr:lysylphosphatidylglycerol synthase transmembrane domain-containing protein [Nitrospira sp. KM1]